MKEIVMNKKRELVFFSLTVILLAFLVSTFSNIIFTAFYKGNEYIFVSCCCLAIFILIIFGYWFLLSERFSINVESNFVYTFSRKKNAFLDIPNCCPSVNMRVLFEKLPIEVKDKYNSHDFINIFHENEFYKFVNQATQAIILCRILKRDILCRSKKWNKIPLDKLPVNFKNNQCINRLINEDGLTVFLGAEIDTFGNENFYIRMISEFGTIEFTWDLWFCPNAPFSEPYVSLHYDLKEVKDYHDFQVQVKLNIDHNLSNIVSDELEEYINFLDNVKKNFENADWKKVESKMPIALISEMIKIQNNKNL